MTAQAPYFTALTYWMAGIGALVWLLTMAVGAYAAKSAPAATRAGRWLIVGLGAVVPGIAITLLLYFGLRPPAASSGTSPAVVAEVTGHMWWWRVRYTDAAGVVAETANELRLPRGRPIELRLDSVDVIHSLWIPALAAKLDMIPGMTNTLVLEPAIDGRHEGVCAEYCGTAHAQMRFAVDVVSPAAFDRWLQHLQAPARPPAAPDAARGAELFRTNGCGACHAVHGTSADGRVGPVLTHLASRRSLGAGSLPMSAQTAATWIAETKRIKPGVHMPAYTMLDEHELAALGAYLAGLE